jgi:hypothetical protein
MPVQVVDAHTLPMHGPLLGALHNGKFMPRGGTLAFG